MRMCDDTTLIQEYCYKKKLKAFRTHKLFTPPKYTITLYSQSNICHVANLSAWHHCNPGDVLDATLPDPPLDSAQAVPSNSQGPCDKDQEAVQA